MTSEHRTQILAETKAAWLSKNKDGKNILSDAEIDMKLLVQPAIGIWSKNH